ncbi:hypothetical protein OSB04_029405, partial [Centaurea solstitialis]
MVFISRQNLIDWVHHVGKSLGYVIVTKRSKTSTIVFQCDRSGIYKSKKISTKNTSTKKINCPFELEGKRSAMEDSWTLRVICEMHNHEPALHLEGHPYARRLTDNEARLVEDLSRKNVKPRDILSILKQDPNNVSTSSMVYNARSKFRMLERAGKTQMQVVMSFFHEKSYVYESRVNHSTDELENLFFAHPKSLEFWHAFPHVVLMDATYQTNRYSLPILEIVGVTPTNKTFCIAFVLMHNEEESSYTWALSCFKSLMGECILPRVIVTDRDLALMKACNVLFPDAKKLLCTWHIYNNIFKRRKLVRSKSTWNSFNKAWTTLVASQTEDAYKLNLVQLETILLDYPELGLFYIRLKNAPSIVFTDIPQYEKMVLDHGSQNFGTKNRQKLHENGTREAQSGLRCFWAKLW